MKRVIFLFLFFCGFATGVFAAELKISLTDLRSQKGVVRVAVFDRQDGFPKDSKMKKFAQTIKTSDSKHFVIKNLKPGFYALAIIHDENGNGKLDGFPPTEGYGFSNDVMGTFGPPKFTKAKFKVTGKNQNLAIKMKYF